MKRLVVIVLLALITTEAVSQTPPPPSPTPSPARLRTITIRLTDAQWDRLKLAAGLESEPWAWNQTLQRAVDVRANGICQEWFDKAIDECAISDEQRRQQEVDFCAEHDLGPDCLK